jgi:hypothetical protein
MRRPVLTAVALLQLLGCSASPERHDPLSDAGDADDADALANTRLEVPPSRGTWHADADVTLEGIGHGDLGAISLSHGLGSITFRGAPATAFYVAGSDIPPGKDGGGRGAADSGPAPGRDLQIIAVQGDRIIVTWVGCYGGDLAFVYYETTDGIASQQPDRASGYCTIVDASAATEAVELPALSMSPPALARGFAIAGADLSFDGVSIGRANFAGASWSMYPFHAIDCSACDVSGWYELHSLFRDKASGNTCIGILYLMAVAPNQVSLDYMTCLPAVTDPIASGQIFASTWKKN